MKPEKLVKNYGIEFSLKNISEIEFSVKYSFDKKYNKMGRIKMKKIITTQKAPMYFCIRYCEFYTKVK